MANNAANSVTNRQIFFILIMTLTTYTTITLPKTLAESAGRSGWTLLFAMALLFGAAAVVITLLNNRFPGVAMYDYSVDIAGKFVSRALGIYFVVYFLLIGTYLNAKLVSFLSMNFLPKTPQFILLAFSVALFAYAANKGVTNVARMFEIFGVLFLITTVSICIIMLFQGMTYNILPLFNPADMRLFPQAFPRLIFPYGGIEVLLIIPFTGKNKKAPLVGFLTMVFIGAFYVLIVESTVCILGTNNTLLYNDSFIEAIKIVYFPIIERTDIFYLTIGLTSLFAGMIMVFLSALEYACRLLPRVDRSTVAPGLGLVLYALCFVALRIEAFGPRADAVSPYCVAFSALVIPAVLLLVATIRKKRGGEGGA